MRMGLSVSFRSLLEIGLPLAVTRGSAFMTKFRGAMVLFAGLSLSLIASAVLVAGCRIVTLCFWRSGCSVMLILRF